MPNFERATERFRVFGIDLNSPTDAVKPGYVPIIENVRSYTDGVIEPRRGFTLIGAVSSSNKTPLHSIRRLNDPNSGNYQRIIGIQDTLSYGTTTFTRATYNSSAVAISGNPVSMVPYRPDQSPSSWMYIGDSSVMRKIVGNNSQSISVGTVHQIGVAPPTNAPRAYLGLQSINKIVNFDTLGTAPNDWETDNVVFLRAANPTLIRRIPASSTVTAVSYDDSGTDFCSVVVPDAFIAVAGMGQLVWFVTAGPAVSPAIVNDVLVGSAATTVESIVYDNSPTNTTYCTIVPARPLPELVKHAVVLLNGATYAQVLDVIPGVNETVAIRVNTGVTTVSATQSLVVMPCIRVNLAGISAGTSIVEDSLGAGGAGAVTVTGAGTSSVKTGWMQITPSSPVDITAFTLTASSYAAKENDYYHLSIRFSDLSKLIQGRVMFDCDTTSLSISSTANNGAGLIRVTTATNHELSTGDTVFINSHNASTNGTWIITKVAATTFDLDGSTFVANAGAVGTVRPQFKKNFYYRPFTPNDLLLTAKGQDTADNTRTTTIQRNQLTKIPPKLLKPPMAKSLGPFDLPPDPETILRSFDPLTPPIENAPTTQTTTGDFQWSELLFRRTDLVPVGELAEQGRYHSINAVRIEVTLSDTSTVWMDVNSATMFGGYEPDVFELGIPYVYRYRYRVSSTGARSNWSPPTISGLSPKRSAIELVVEAPSNAPEVDKIDIQRLGGASTSWLNVGTTPIGTLTYVDKVSDSFAIGSAPFAEDDTNYQPWAETDVPFATTATSVVGSYITTSAPLPTNLAKGTPVRVNGIDTAFRRIVSSTASIYEMQDAVGTITNATVEIPAPLKYAQPMASMWWHAGRLFGCRSTRNPGVLFYSNRNDPDSQAEGNYLEVTSPSEPLMNGCSFNGKNYVWSSERMFELQDLGELVAALEIPGGKGLFAPWCLAVGERMWFLSKDGIYQTGGGDCISITDATLKPLFVKEGGAGTAVNGFLPPDMAQTSKLRLSYYDGYLYFIYQDSGGTLRCLTYTLHAEQPGWWPDSYFDGRGVACLYGEEGSGVHNLLAGGNDATTANLYTAGGTADNTAPIVGTIRTQSFDAKDRRAMKQFGDLIVDADSQGATITPQVWINNYSTTASITPTVLSTSTGGRTQTIIDTTSGIGFEARNAALNLSWTSTGLIPKLYLWEPSYIVLPETSILRASYWDDCGYAGDKFFQGIEITTDTQNASRTVLVEYDGGAGVGVLGDTLTIQHNGNIQKAYAFDTPFIAHQIRLRPTDSNGWKSFSYRFIWEKEPPLGNYWQTQQTAHGYSGFIHLKAMYVSIMSTVDVTMTVTRTDDGNTDTYTIPTTTGLRRKVYVPLEVTKGKSFTYTFASTGPGFRIYKDTTDVLVKSWGSNSAFTNRNTFGLDHGNGAADI